MAGIREIAKLAGVSQATVSRVLNRDETFSVSDATRMHILEIANQLQYNPKSSVKSKSLDKLSIALITALSKKTEMNDPYFISIRNGIESEANEWGIRILNLIRFPSEEFKFEDLAAYGAVVVVGGMEAKALAKMAKANPNLIVVDEHRFFPKYDVIRNDFDEQIKQELDILYERGHRKIAYIGGNANLVNQKGKTDEYLGDVRERAYREWMAYRGLADEIAVVQTQWTTESGVVAAEKLLADFPEATAAIVASDPLAIGVYRGLQKAGKQIPQDMAIFSFDDIGPAEYLVPSLSTVKPASEEMGRMAIRLVRDRLFYHREVPIQVIVPSELKIRESI